MEIEAENLAADIMGAWAKKDHSKAELLKKAEASIAQLGSLSTSLITPYAKAPLSFQPDLENGTRKRTRVTFH